MIGKVYYGLIAALERRAFAPSCRSHPASTNRNAPALKVVVINTDDVVQSCLSLAANPGLAIAVSSLTPHPHNTERLYGHVFISTRFLLRRRLPD
jgi:hypothetical protein